MAERLEVIISAVDRASGVLNNVGIAIAKEKAALQGLNEVASQFEATGRRQLVASAALGAGIVAIMKPTMDFEQNMRNVNSIVQAGEAQFQGMRKSVLDIARDRMITDMPETLAQGLYNIQSSGIQGNAAMETLSISSKGAAAGLSETSTAARVLTAVMNAYNTRTGADAQHIMDVLFRTVDRGVVTFDELAQNFSFASTTAAAAGVPLEEVAAGMMTMTKQGHDAAISSTALQRIITSLMDPSKELNGLLRQWGYESGLQLLHTRGLAGAVEWLTTATQGQQDVMVQMLGEQRAVRAAFALTGSGAQMFAEDLNAAKNAQGAYGAAAAEQAKGPMFQWRESLKQLRIDMIGLGNTALPVLTRIAEKVRGVLTWFDGLSEPQKRAMMNFALIGAAGLAFAGVTNLVIGSGIRMLANWRGLGAGARALWGLLRGGGGAAQTTSAISTVGRAWQWLGTVTKASWAEQWTATATSGRGIVNMLKGLPGMIGKIGPALRGVIPSIIAFGKAGLTFLVSPVGVVIAALAALTYELYKLYGVYKEMRAAQAEAKQKKAEQEAADKEFGVTRDKTGAIVRIANARRIRAATVAQQERANADAAWSGGATGAGLVGPNGMQQPPGATDWNAMLAQARAEAAAEQAKSEGVGGAQQYLAYVQQAGQAELSELYQRAQASGQQKDWDAYEKARRKYAQDIAGAEANVGAQAGKSSPRSRRGGVSFGGGFSGGAASGSSGVSASGYSIGGYGGGAGVETVATPAAVEGYGRPVTLTFYVNSKEELKRVAQAEIDKAWAR